LSSIESFNEKSLGDGVNLSQFSNSFPRDFDFYHLGKVALTPSNTLFEELTVDDLDTVIFHLYGDVRALVILFFQKSLDRSTYTELGNVLASQIATQLASQTGTDVMISPPQHLNDSQRNQIIRHKLPLIRKNYLHYVENLVVPLETWVLPFSSEGVGYA
jgi:CheC-like family